MSATPRHSALWAEIEDYSKSWDKIEALDEFAEELERELNAKEKECAELRKRIDEADAIILQLTMDHHSSPNYVSGFERARGYFSRYPNSATMKGE